MTAIFHEIKTDDYLLLEQQNHASANEIKHALEAYQHTELHDVTVTLYADSGRNLQGFLEAAGYAMLDERIHVTRSLRTLKASPYYYTYRRLGEIPREEFIQLLGRASAASLNRHVTEAAAMLRAAEKELGENYRKSCCAVYLNEEAIGVVMPHIEPGKPDEGRIFFLGLLPEARGQGYGRKLHHDALQLLKQEFHTKTYIGATGVRNVPMQRIFTANDCEAGLVQQIFKRTNEQVQPT